MWCQMPRYCMKGDGVFCCSGQDWDGVGSLLEVVFVTASTPHPGRLEAGKEARSDARHGLDSTRLLARGGSGLAPEGQEGQSRSSCEISFAIIENDQIGLYWLHRALASALALALAFSTDDAHVSSSSLPFLVPCHSVLLPCSPPRDLMCVHAVVESVSVRALASCRGLRRNAQHPHVLGTCIYDAPL